jgi:hypothetical protein
LAAKALAMRNILCGKPETQKKHAGREEKLELKPKREKGGG